MFLIIIILTLLCQVEGYWDIGTTTPDPYRTDTRARTSFFRWQMNILNFITFWVYIDTRDEQRRRRLCHIAGVSIDLIPLSTGAILNRRTVLTAANYLDPHMNRQRDVRVWALGRTGEYNTPYRYRVWSIWRVLPKSNNPEHQHGPRGTHVPRHDIAIIITHDQIYLYGRYPKRYQYAYAATLTRAHDRIWYEELLMTGSGYEYMLHIKENYKIFFGILYRSDIVDCSRWLPKWWGKFICIKNVKRFPGVQNGGALLSYSRVYGVGCFEIRYNEDRFLVFTDVRYYVHLIHKIADIYPGQYYEYAYPQWGINLGIVYDGNLNSPGIQSLGIMRDLFPLG